MYSKLAGKSFLGPYMKVRNSAAAVAEVRGRDDGMAGGLPIDELRAFSESAPVQSLAELAAASPSVNELIREQAPVREKAPAQKPAKPAPATTNAEGLF